VGFRNCFSRFGGDESGAIAIWAGLSVPMILGIGALAFDMNSMYVTKAQLRHTADAAAIAAAKALPDQTAALGAAQNYAQLNMPSATHGMVVAPGDVTPGNWDPASRVFTPSGSPVNAVKVAARRDQQNGNPIKTLIASALGVTSVNVSASSIAAQRDPGIGGACIISLNETASGAFHLHGTAEVKTSECDIQVNSCNATDALLASGQTLVKIIGLTGQIKVCGKVLENGPAMFDPTPLSENAAYHIADPFLGMNFPTVPACTYNNFSWSGGDTTLQPGVYCGGISLTGNGTVTFAGGAANGFNHGEYIIKDGELHVGGNVIAATDGLGVTFFMTGAAATVKFVGTADIGLNASHSGVYAGFIFFGDRDHLPTDYHSIRGTSLGGYNGKI